jgi:hypothetical protein
VTVIKIKNSNVSGRLPASGDIEIAELALNIADKKLYSKDAAGSIFEIGVAGDLPSGPNPPNSGNNIGDIFYDTTEGNLVYWDGSAWIPIPGDPDGNGFVKVDGDNMTGNLTLGTDKITLDAGTGKGEFSDGVKATGRSNFEAKTGDSAVIQITGDLDTAFPSGNVYYASVSGDINVDSTGIASCYTTSIGGTGAIADLSIFRANSKPLALDNIEVIKGYEASGISHSTRTKPSYGFFGGLTSTNPYAYNFYAEGTAPNYFKGLTENAGGVKITGGNSLLIPTGIFSTNIDNLQLQTNHGNGTFIVSAGTMGFPAIATSTKLDIKDTLPSGQDYLIGIATDIQCSNPGKNIYNMLSDVSTDVTIPNTYTGFLSRVRSGTSPSVDTACYGFSFESRPFTSAPELYGFYSTVNTTHATSAYNFYAAGNAPNYFRGRLKIGPNSIASDREWITTTDQGIHFATTAAGISNAVFEIQSNYNASSSQAIGCIFTRPTSDIDTTPLEQGTIKILRDDQRGIIINHGVDGSVIGTSDYRIKTNVATLSNASATIKNLNPVTFDTAYKTGYVGFVAHELQQYVPQAVSGTKDATEAIGTLADYNGTVLETAVVEPEAEELTYTEEVETDGVATMVTRTRTWTATGTQPVYQGVDQTKLIPLLTKALQEALERIEALEAAA